MRTIYSCGCVNEVHESGVMRCIYKCLDHIMCISNQATGLKYYMECGSVTEDGLPRPDAYIAELKQGFGPRLGNLLPGRLLEIGCGASPYVQYWLDRGFDYFGIDPDPWATSWVHTTYQVATCAIYFEKMAESSLKYSVIFSAHAFEHMRDSPAMLQKAYDMLEVGGSIVLVLPDDTDKTNPDHYWFFNASNLGALLRRIGFQDVAVNVLSIVPKENFLYAIGTK